MWTVTQVPRVLHRLILGMVQVLSDGGERSKASLGRASQIFDKIVSADHVYFTVGNGYQTGAEFGFGKRLRQAKKLAHGHIAGIRSADEFRSSVGQHDD